MSSVSFRITQHTEDLAHTIHALSQRVVRLEQRLAELEAHLATPVEENPTPEHLASLANVDQLLRDCRELLSVQPAEPEKGVAPLAEVAPLHPLEDVA